MSDIKLVALRDHPFGTGIRVAGEEYMANESEAATLRALGWAEDAKEKPAKSDKSHKGDDEEKSKGHYKTRDLKAGK